MAKRTKTDISGQRFGFLTALRFVPTEGPRTKYLFRCDCGAEKEIRSEHVLSGLTKSCGCHHKRVVSRLKVGRRVVDDFWGNVDASGNCWIWMRAKMPLGYGHLWVDGRDVYAHRYAYESYYLSIDQDLDIDHLCRTPSCVNPLHLELVTRRENTVRGHRSRRLGIS
jgi:hypothetical protein